MRSSFAGLQPLISGLLNSIYPSHCPVCNGKSDASAYAPLCSSCWSEIKRTSGPTCRVCAIPFVSAHARICGDCLRLPPPFSRVISYGVYEGVLKEAISQFKFRGLRRLARPMGSLLAGLEIPRADAITPVPMTARGLRQRGFNQAALIAKVVSKEAGIELNIDSLRKMKETRPQVGLSSAERRSNLRGAFTAKKDLKDAHVILVDDVVTTGATASACSEALLKAGAKEVTVLAIARAGLI